MRQTNKQIMSGVETQPGTKARRIANNTVRYIAPNGDEVIRLHNTNIVTRHLDGSITLNSGGWRTVTTKARLNEYSPARISQRDYAWYIATPSGELPFEDGLKLDRMGNVIAPSIAPTAEETEYNRDLVLRVRDNQIGSGMRHR